MFLSHYPLVFAHPLCLEGPSTLSGPVFPVSVLCSQAWNPDGRGDVGRLSLCIWLILFTLMMPTSIHIAANSILSSFLFMTVFKCRFYSPNSNNKYVKWEFGLFILKLILNAANKGRTQTPFSVIFPFFFLNLPVSHFPIDFSHQYHGRDSDQLRSVMREVTCGFVSH